jgi:hypothetical protein
LDLRGNRQKEAILLTEKKIASTTLCSTQRRSISPELDELSGLGLPVRVDA